MPTLFLICGLPGAGKTALAKQIAQERRALRLTPDDWMRPLFGTMTQEQLDAKRTPVESVQWEVASRALELGIDVVLDWGFWSRQERDDFRARAAAVGAASEVLYLDVSLEELRARLRARNAILPQGNFVVTDAQLDRWWSLFQPPDRDELTHHPGRSVTQLPP